MNRNIPSNKRCTIKVPLKSIYAIDKSYDILGKSIKQTNDVLEFGLLFMKSYLIYKFENESNEITNKEIIKTTNTTKILKQTKNKSKTEIKTEPNNNNQVPVDNQVPINKSKTEIKTEPNNNNQVPVDNQVPINNQTIIDGYPVMNVDYVRKIFSVIMKKEGGGRPIKGEDDPELEKINEYFEIFKKETGINKLKVECISYILGQEYKKIIEAILNNIKYHLEAHIKRYIRANFYETYQLIRSEKSSEELKEFHANMNKIKNDILGNTKTSPEIYHQWIDNNIKLIIPSTYTKLMFKEDVDINAYSYIKCMYNINKFIQSKNLKSLSIFPTKKSTFNSYVKINTAALIDIFYGIKFTFDGNTKIDLLTRYGEQEIQEKVWNSVFNLKDSTNKYIFNHKGFSFNYELETDGYATSLNFINNNEIPNKGKKKKNTANKRGETNDMKYEIKKQLLIEIIEDVKLELKIELNDILTDEKCDLIEKTINNKFKDKKFLKEYDLKVNEKYESKLNENNAIKNAKDLENIKLQKEARRNKNQRK